MINRRELGLRLLLGCGLALSWTYGVRAEEARWPSKPVKLIVPVAPGGTADSTARLIAEHLAQSWGQSVVVDNRAGAGGAIAMDALFRAPADGHTLAIGTLNSVVTNAMVMRKLTYDATTLTPLTWLTSSPLFLIVNPQLPIKSLPEFVAYAKNHPDELSFASIGSGSTMHLAMALLMERTGIRLVHVPYKGMGNALQDLVAGNVGVAIDISAMSMVHAGKLRAIAVVADQRYPGEPEIPAFGELGLRGLQVQTFLSLHAPPGLPVALSQRINEDVNRVLALPVVTQKLKAMNLDPQGGSPGRLQDHLQGERRRFADLIRRTGIQAE